jgi:hypothetical protein
MNDLLGRLSISKTVINYGRGLPALEVPRLFFAQGYISACGDALYCFRDTKQARWPKVLSF